jgi:shikimate dehydrogenase
MRRLLAVLGGDVGRSLSPLIHGAAAAANDLDVAYVPVDCATPADFDRSVHALRALGAIGCNVTHPHKGRALELCQRHSTTAQEIGAVNTMTFASDGSIQGDNTDGPGLVRVLQGLPPGLMERVQILGSGGAARAAAWAVARSTQGPIHVSARRGAEEVAALVKGRADGLGPVRGATLVVSALPGDHTLARTALDDWINVDERPAVLDLAYGDLEQDSALVLMAKARGLVAYDGRGLLVEQAALSLALWTGGEVSRIRRSMRIALRLDAEA